MDSSQKNIKVLISETEIKDKVLDFANKLNREFAGEELYLICVLRGGVMFMTDLARYLTMPVKMEFVRLSSYNFGTISSGKVNADDMGLPDLNGKNVLIIEDIIDTGNTAKFMINYMKNRFKLKSFKFCTLLDKKARREVQIDADYTCFEIEDKFVVGYGMDYNEHYRNLPYIGYIEE